MEVAESGGIESKLIYTITNMKTFVHQKINLRAMFGNNNPKQPSFVKHSNWQWQWCEDLRIRSRAARVQEAFNPLNNR